MELFLFKGRSLATLEKFHLWSWTDGWPPSHHLCFSLVSVPVVPLIHINPQLLCAEESLTHLLWLDPGTLGLWEKGAERGTQASVSEETKLCSVYSFLKLFQLMYRFFLHLEVLWGLSSLTSPRPSSSARYFELPGILTWPVSGGSQLLPAMDLWLWMSFFHKFMLLLSPRIPTPLWGRRHSEVLNLVVPCSRGPSAMGKWEWYLSGLLVTPSLQKLIGYQVRHSGRVLFGLLQL